MQATEAKSYPTQIEKIKEITDQLEAGIKSLFESEKFKLYLKTLSKFHSYSLNNTLLITMQKPDATLVAGYSTWKRMGRQVVRGEKGIRVLAPSPYRKKKEIDKVDPVTGTVLVNPDGSPIKETTEILIPAFKVVSVFDVSQTEGRPIPSLLVEELSGSVKEYEVFFEALKRTCPVPISFEEIPGSAKGYFHLLENRIAIQAGMSEVQTIKTGIHEAAHQKLHSLLSKKEEGMEDDKMTVNQKEVEAEAVAYTVCQHYGIETSEYSFGYIAGWSEGKDTPELKASLDRIRIASNDMITSIDDHIRDIRKERGIEQQETVPKESVLEALQNKKEEQKCISADKCVQMYNKKRQKTHGKGR